MQPEIRIGVDIGGTFTDFVIFSPENGRIETFKLLSDRREPAKPVLVGLLKIFQAYPESRRGVATTIVHGSTVATNALLERKGATTALVTTKGFRDVLQIGRQERPQLYDFFADPPEPLVPERLRFEVDERVDSEGEVLRPLEIPEIDLLLRKIEESGAKSIAVSLLFSFLNPQPEGMIAQRLRAAGYAVSVSSEILPVFREYERTSTTVVNAYVSPVLESYLSTLHRSLTGDRRQNLHLRVMQSNGGAIGLDEARRHGVQSILSGPAGGVIGACYIAQAGSLESNAKTGRTNNPPLRLITFDMGGTSTDVSLVDGSPGLTSESSIGGIPIRVQVLDIHTVGSGGGSIASVDLGGALRVGPQSAGADPGPACYGLVAAKDAAPTVTDANLVLGRLAADHFLGGEIQLDKEAAHRVIARLGNELGLDVTQTALGILQVVNSHMEHALRVISLERGYDPRLFSLFSFGGAGGLHAVDLARRLGIPRVIVSPLASTLSAFGMLTAKVIKDYSQTVMLPGDSPYADIARRFEPIIEKGINEIAAEGWPRQEVVIERSLDIRFKGQSYELNVRFAENFIELFHELHHTYYGYARRSSPVEIVNLRLRAIGPIIPPPLASAPPGDPDPSPAFLERRPVVINQPSSSSAPKGYAELEIPFYQGEALRPGNQLEGPAVVVRSDTTILLGPGDRASVDPYFNLLITLDN